MRHVHAWLRTQLRAEEEHILLATFGITELKRSANFWGNLNRSWQTGENVRLTRGNDNQDGTGAEASSLYCARFNNFGQNWQHTLKNFRSRIGFCVFLGSQLSGEEMLPI
jgi:hypothetical protein